MVEFAVAHVTFLFQTVSTKSSTTRGIQGLRGEPDTVAPGKPPEPILIQVDFAVDLFNRAG